MKGLSLPFSDMGCKVLGNPYMSDHYETNLLGIRNIEEETIHLENASHHPNHNFLQKDSDHLQ